MYHLWTQNALHVAANRSTRTGVIDKKYRSRYIEQLTDFGSFLALFINSTLHEFFYRPCRVLANRILSRGLAPSGIWPRKRIACGMDGKRARAHCETNNNGSANTQLHLDRATTLRSAPERNLVFASRPPSREKNDRLRETSPDTSVNRLGKRKIFLRASRLHFN